MANCVTEWIAETALKHAAEHGPDFGGTLVREAIAKKKYDPRQLNLKVLAETALGRHTFAAKLQAWGSKQGWVSEAVEATDLSAFRSIIRANVAAVMESGYTDAVSVSDQLVGKEPDEDGTDPMAPNRIPVAATATDEPGPVAPGMPYPVTGFGPNYIETPIPEKVGQVGLLTLEMVKANASRRFVDAMKEVGRKVGVHHIKARLRVVLGINNNYKRNGTSYNTYLTSGDRINKLTDFDVTQGPKELDRLAQVFDAMTNPFTGEPMDVDVGDGDILTVRANQFGLREAVGTQEIRITNAAGQTVTSNPFAFGGDIMADRYVYNLLVNEGGLSTTQAATWLAMGDFPRAFKEREVEPFYTHEVGPNDDSWPPHFFQDVVYGCKARYWCAIYVADPFAVVSGYKAS